MAIQVTDDHKPEREDEAVRTRGTVMSVLCTAGTALLVLLHCLYCTGAFADQMHAHRMCVSHYGGITQGGSVHASCAALPLLACLVYPSQRQCLICRASSCCAVAAGNLHVMVWVYRVGSVLVVYLQGGAHWGVPQEHSVLWTQHTHTHVHASNTGCNRITRLLNGSACDGVHI